MKFKNNLLYYNWHTQDNSLKGIGNWLEEPQSVEQDQKSDNLQYDMMGR